MALQAVVLKVIRLLGGFAAAQYLTRRRLRILCYHGFSLGDEYEVLPHVFMRKETFERRMQILNKRQLKVISLQEGLARLEAGKIEQAETVITFDDGWATNLTVGAEILERFNFPATIYVTTEHLGQGTEVFNVAFYYMLCHSPRKTLDLSEVDERLRGSFDLAGDRVSCANAVIEETESVFPRLADRQALLPRLAKALGMNLTSVLANGRFRLLAGAEMKHLSAHGFDLQLHTHSHRLPDSSFGAMAPEIERNRDALGEILGGTRADLCYPSGKYSAAHLEWLPRLNIRSATTCNPGLNDSQTHPLQLRRYLDSERVSDIVFEAEICGLRDLARDLRATVSAYFGGASRHEGQLGDIPH
jgi:peptidoglycan/xylan/chitin deacetylase (PgdA/CDA1 family)